MPGLAETIARLKRNLGSAAPGPASTTLLETAEFGPNLGGLRMLSFVPAGLPAGAPLVVALHGCTQTAAGYDAGSGWSQLASRHGFAVLLPEQVRANNQNLCFNWFQPGDTARGGGEAASIRAMVAHLVAEHRLDARRVFVTGLSAGGAMAASLLAAYPDAFAAGAVIAGLPHGSAGSVQEALGAMRQPRVRRAAEWGEFVRAASPHRGPWPHVQVWHGDADGTVAPGNADETLKQWLDVHGLDARPSAEDQVDGARHRVWRGRDGAALVESYRVPGLGHGTPIDPGAAEAERRCGTAMPHMLDAGISSTYHIARSWGLAGAGYTARAGATARPAAPGGAGGAIDPAAIVEQALKSAGVRWPVRR